jgi:hypothetical protein
MILRVDLSATLTPRDVYARLDLPACLDVTLGHHAFASLPFVPVAQDSDPAATPVFAPPAGAYSAPFTLTLSCATPDAVIYYTLDGSTPTQASTPYTGPILVPWSASFTLTALAIAPGFLPSAVATGAFSVQAQPATPTLTRDSAGVYSIACATDGASIYYTLDGSDPDSTKTLYATPLDIIFPQTLKAIAIKDAVSSEVATSVITESVWTIDPAADGTRYFRIQCADAGQTLTVTGGAEIKLGADGTWGTSVDIPGGATNRFVYFRGNGTGGKLLIPSPQNVTLLYINSTFTYITGSINGMSLTSLTLAATYTSITGAPPQIGTPLLGMRIIGGTTYDYPWTSQTFGGTKRTWGIYSMNIDCVAAAPTPAQFNTWLLGLASVSNAGTATLTLKNTPTLAAMTAAGLVSDGSGYYAMTTTLGYKLVLGE